MKKKKREGWVLAFMFNYIIELEQFFDHHPEILKRRSLRAGEIQRRTTFR